MRRGVGLLLALLLGLAAGLFYGWVVHPARIERAALSGLREDYRVDYVLMVAEVYHADQDGSAASLRLAELGNLTPVQCVEQAMATARQLNYTEADLQRLAELFDGLQAGPPASTGGAP